MSKRSSMEISYVDEEENLHCRYNDASEIIAELEAELEHCANGKADDDAMLVQYRQHIAELQAENAKLKEEAILSLFEPDNETLADRNKALEAELALERKIKELVTEKWPGTIAWATAKAKEGE